MDRPMTDSTVDHLRGPAPRSSCPGRTCFDALIEGWHDQATVRHLLDVLHRRELTRATWSPVVHVTTPDNSWWVDPSAGVVAVTVGGSPVYPGIRESDQQDGSGERPCACGCGEPVTSPRPGARYATPACRAQAARAATRKARKQ